MRVGSDPELFLKTPSGKHISVIGKVGGSKEHPKPIFGMPEGFTLQEDNVALELGMPPAASKQQFVQNVRAAMLAGLKAVPGSRFSRLSCTVFSEDEMDHPAAWVFGCEPDYNAWTGRENEKPQSPNIFMRSAGGHIHIETQLDKLNVIRACDVQLGLGSVLLDTEGVERRQLYGKAGAFRPKSYGVEYRTLSNFWIFRPKLIEWVWDRVEDVLTLCQQEWWMPNKLEASAIQRAINTGDRRLAESLIREFDVVMP